jgi:hypothetical protein
VTGKTDGNRAFSGLSNARRRGAGRSIARDEADITAGDHRFDLVAARALIRARRAGGRIADLG